MRNGVEPAEGVSIRAPAQGATSGTGGGISTGRSFYPRSRAGSDAQFPMRRIIKRFVSIRAPAQGATTTPENWHEPRSFLSALPRRERQMGLDSRPDVWAFLSALPRRERHQIGGAPSPLGRRFYPRSRAGSDNGTSIDYPCAIVSIRAPAQGATMARQSTTPVQLFLSALPRRERRLQLIRKGRDRHVSIRAPAQGATGSIISGCGVMPFLSALPRRERRPDESGGSTIAASRDVSIRAPAQGAT